MTLRTNPRFLLRAALLAFLGLAGIAALPQSASATIQINDIKTSYGDKEGVPATLSATNIRILGKGFIVSYRGMSVQLFRYVSNNELQLVRTLTPTLISNIEIRANIGVATPGYYYISVKSNSVPTNFDVALLSVISPATKLESFVPTLYTGESATLRGNLLPTVSPRVTLIPPADMAPYMVARTVIPYYVDRYAVRFNIPADLWGGTWKVKYSGLLNPITEITTNELEIFFFDKDPALYYVRLARIDCVKTTWGLGGDEVFGSMICVSEPGSTATHRRFGRFGTPMYMGVTGGQSKYPGVWLNHVGDFQDGYYAIWKPETARYVIGLAECEQWIPTLDGWGWFGYHRSLPEVYGEHMASMTVDAWCAQQATDPVLKAMTIGQVANWVKNRLYQDLNSEDDCIGTGVVSFTKAEANWARYYGQPVVKTLTFYGFGGTYKAVVHLKRED